MDISVHSYIAMMKGGGGGGGSPNGNVMCQVNVKLKREYCSGMC